MFRRLLAVFCVLLVLLGVGVVLFVKGLIGGDAVRRTLESQLSARVGEPVTIASLSASFFPRVELDLHEVAVGQPVRATITEISIATGLRGLLSRRVEGAEVVVSNSRLPVGMVLGIVGAAASDGSADTSGAGLTIVSISTLVFRKVELVAGPRSLTVDLESSLDGDRLEVGRLIAQSQGTRLEARGALTSIAKHEGKFTAAAGRLNLDELLAVASTLSSEAPAPKSAPAAAAASPIDLQLELTAPGGELGGYTFQTLSSTLRVTPRQILLQPLKFGIFGGQFDGQLRVLSSAGAPDIALNGRVDRLDVARLLREVRGSSPMSGLMSGTVALASRGSSSDDVVRAAHGSGRVTIADGVIPGLEMVRPIVLAFGKPSGAPPAGSGSSFTQLGGNFTLADRTLRVPDITFASRDFDMAGTALVRFPTGAPGALDVHANVMLSRELTAQAGTDLRRYAQEDGRVVVPATITGTLAAPNVSIDIAAAVNRALQNEAKRKLKGYLDRIIRHED
jgi:AsmA-like C-terminal region